MLDMDPREIQRNLKTERFGRKIFFFDEIESTNQYAWKLAEKGEVEGTIVLAKSQYKGRGRMGREWFSPKGGLWLSVILKPFLKINVAEKVTLMAGVSIVEVINELYGLAAKLKWVNDVLVNQRKVAGVLTESSVVNDRINFMVLGIGVNVNVTQFPQELKDIATSISLELGKLVNLNEFSSKLLEKLELNYKSMCKSEIAKIVEKWKKYSATLGRFVEIYSNGEKLTGKAIDIDEEGFLILELESGEKIKVLTGTCRHVT